MKKIAIVTLSIVITFCASSVEALKTDVQLKKNHATYQELKADFKQTLFAQLAPLMRN